LSSHIIYPFFWPIARKNAKKCPKNSLILILLKYKLNKELKKNILKELKFAPAGAKNLFKIFLDTVMLA
jgi:hypothetical protein